MKKAFCFTVLIFLIVWILPAAAEDKDSLEYVRGFAKKNIQWMGNAALKITGEANALYFDPLPTVNIAQAGIILITHQHADHFNPEAIKRLIGTDTVVIAPEPYLNNAKIIKAGERIDINGVAIEAVPAYNIHGNPHPRNKQWVGYIVTIDGIRIYVSGDTDRIPEMEGLKVDIAILSIPGSGAAMDFEEGAKAIRDIAPRVAVPVHYIGVITDPQAGGLFKRLVNKEVEVVLKPIAQF